MFDPRYFLELHNVDASLGEEIFLQKIQYSFESGKKYAIMGETGSGKTLLAKIMSGLEPVKTGSVTFQGEMLKNPLELLIPGHTKIAYLSQYFELPKNYYVKDFLDFENHIEENKAAHLKKICRIEHLLNRKTQAMSGGEKQRVALTKKLMLLPELLILDEPFAHLDYPNRQIMKSVIQDYLLNYKANSILVTHDYTDIYEQTDELLILREGRLIASGKPKDLYYRPSNMYVAQLLGPSKQYAVKDLCFDLSIDGNILLRPDFFYITEGEGDFMGIVSQAHFNGIMYHITVTMPNDRQIWLYHPELPQLGSKVSVHFRREFLHRLP